MPKKNKSFDKLTLAASALIIVAVLYFAYTFFIGLTAPAISVNSSLGQFKTVNSDAVAAVKGLNACGNWPLIAVSLSADRGNPFNRKSAAASPMVATSSILCLPVTE